MVVVKEVPSFHEFKDIRLAIYGKPFWVVEEILA